MKPQDWALLEGKPGTFLAEGIFALKPFFEAATQAGIYLLARPGPYVNAEGTQAAMRARMTQLLTWL